MTTISAPPNPGREPQPSRPGSWSWVRFVLTLATAGGLAAPFLVLGDTTGAALVFGAVLSIAPRQNPPDDRTEE